MKKRLFVLFAALVLCQCVSAHMPGASPAPEVDLGPIVVSENGEPVEITLDDVGAYHGALEGKNPDVCICCGCTYRALLSGIQEIWGDEIPERSDIGLKCWLISNGSVHAAWYVTGTGPGMDPAYRGEVEFIGVDGVPIASLTQSAIKKNSKARTLESFRFEITQRSSGTSVERTVSGEIFPEGFAEMRKKVKFEKTATPDEIKQFVSDYSATRDAVLQMPDYELFNEVEEPEEEAPDVMGGGIFLALLGVLCVGLIVMHRRQ
ncbi:hypothetical protein E2N92_11810 [Methanofollis formosanus]|uniref:Uncharacterized protein n=1 Tax=Methanofollis formosanus TaxID=299308 RepID=A0A8G1A2N7_9EURY|nr:hypothetical protein [Methanofollis formosanus]QYZ80062.1 hypothetical protein E2N92_11810 [Methanofollis formosanus]